MRTHRTSTGNTVSDSTTRAMRLQHSAYFCVLVLELLFLHAKKCTLLHSGYVSLDEATARTTRYEHCSGRVNTLQAITAIASMNLLIVLATNCLSV
jgi:hypothetical protein